MKKNCTPFAFCIVSFVFMSILLTSCSKQQNSRSSKSLSYSDLYSGGGIVHNQLLGSFVAELENSNSELSIKLNNIVLQYKNAARGTFPRTVAPSTEELTELQYQINAAVTHEVIPVSISYLQNNGFYERIQQEGIEDPEFVVSRVVDEIYNSASFSSEKYVEKISSGQSSSFQGFVVDLRRLIENVASSTFLSQIEQLEESYLSRTTDAVEALAIINGCETAKASFEYWSDISNTTSWDNIVTNDFSPELLSSIKTLPRKVKAHDNRDIIVADAVGAIGGVIEGALIGAAAGPGGAMVVGAAGTILRGAQASAAEYVLNKLKNWLFG